MALNKKIHKPKPTNSTPKPTPQLTNSDERAIAGVVSIVMTWIIWLVVFLVYWLRVQTTVLDAGMCGSIVSSVLGLGLWVFKLQYNSKARYYSVRLLNPIAVFATGILGRYDKIKTYHQRYKQFETYQQFAKQHYLAIKKWLIINCVVHVGLLLLFILLFFSINYNLNYNLVAHWFSLLNFNWK